MLRLFKSSLNEFQIVYSKTPPYDHPVITATLFRPEQKLSQSFSYLKNPFNTATPLIRPDFCGPLASGWGAVASCLVRSTAERALRVRALAGDIVLCSWVRHFTLTVPLSTQVYKWVPANLMLGVTLRWTSIPSRGE